MPTPVIEMHSALDHSACDNGSLSHQKLRSLILQRTPSHPGLSSPDELLQDSCLLDHGHQKMPSVRPGREKFIFINGYLGKTLDAVKMLEIELGSYSNGIE